MLSKVAPILLRGAYLCVASAFLAGCASMRPQLPDVPDLAAESLTELVGKVRAQALSYDAKWKSLESDQWGESEKLFAGGGVAAGGLLAQSPPTAAVGALYAGYVGAVDKFYGQDKQNAAFSAAAHSLHCAKGITDMMALNTVTLVTIESPDSPGEMADAYVTRKLLSYAQDAYSRLVERLRINAVSTQPDWSSFQTAVRNAATSQPAQVTGVPVRIAKLTGPENAAKDAAADVKNAKQEALEKTLGTAVGRYASDLAICQAMN